MKSGERFILRGKLDSLNAQIIFLQTCSDNEEYIADLEELRGIVRQLQHCEASSTPFKEDFVLWGKTADELHELSHNPDGGHIMPHMDMKRESAGLNLLRTLVRETELASCRAFPHEDTLRISHTLNRLSSAVYVLMFKYLPEGYGHRLTFRKA
ncbi:MAG: hypothetical protein IJT02_00555 [Synergistaceae bacterium]|nr:hypothetical protein [Synergistaceae bacterium]